MKELKQRQGVTNFVSLEPPDQMPAGRRRQQRNLGARFLDPALAKKLLAGVESGSHLFGFVRFGYRHQLDVIGRPAARSQRVSDLRANALQILRNWLHLCNTHLCSEAATARARYRSFEWDKEKASKSEVT